MKLPQFLLFALILLGIAGFVTYFIVDHTAPKEVYTIHFNINVVDSGVGFILDHDKFHYGDVKQGAYSTRRIKLNNSHDYNQRVTFLIASNISMGSWLYVEPYYPYILGSKKIKQFSLNMHVPPQQPLGNYSGYIHIKTYKAWPWQEADPDLPGNDTQPIANEREQLIIPTNSSTTID